MFTRIGFVFLLIFAFGLSGVVFSQDALSDEGSDLWKTDQFVDEDELNDPNQPDIIQELEQGNSNQYYSDEEIYRIQRQYYAERKSTINTDEVIAQTAGTLKDNILYGVGSGVIIGAWLAVINKGTSRENFQLIGTGAVLGGLLGFLVGTKAFYIVPPPKVNDPNQQQNPNNDVYGLFDRPLEKRLVNQNNPSQVALNFSFTF